MALRRFNQRLHGQRKHAARSSATSDDGVALATFTRRTKHAVRLKDGNNDDLKDESTEEMSTTTDGVVASGIPPWPTSASEIPSFLKDLRAKASAWVGAARDRVVEIVGGMGKAPQKQQSDAGRAPQKQQHNACGAPRTRKARVAPQTAPASSSATPRAGDDSTREPWEAIIEAGLAESLAALSVSKLRRKCAERGIETLGFTEKQDFITALLASGGCTGCRSHRL